MYTQGLQGWFQKKTTGTSTVATQRCCRTGIFVTAFGPHLHNDRCSTSAVPGPAYWTLVCKTPAEHLPRTPDDPNAFPLALFFAGYQLFRRRPSPGPKRLGRRGRGGLVSIIPVASQTECGLMRERDFHLKSFINPVGTHRLPHHPASGTHQSSTIPRTSALDAFQHEALCCRYHPNPVTPLPRLRRRQLSTLLENHRVQLRVDFDHPYE